MTGQSESYTLEEFTRDTVTTLLQSGVQPESLKDYIDQVSLALGHNDGRLTRPERKNVKTEQPFPSAASQGGNGGDDDGFGELKSLTS